MATISQRISLEGSEDILKQLEALGKTGEQAFKQIQDAAKKPITDPAQIDKTKQAITALAVAGERLGPQFQKLADSAQQFGTQGEQAAKQVTTGLDQTSAAAQNAATTIQQAAQQASSAGGTIGATLAKAAVVFGVAATGIAAAISAITSALTSGTVETATAIAGQAEALKVTIGQWLALRKAIAGTGVTNDELKKSISDLTENFAKADGGIQRLGNGITEQSVKVRDGVVTIRRYGDSYKGVQSEADKAATELRKYGITTQDIAKGDVTAALNKAADSLFEIKDATQQASAGTAQFGPKWKEIMEAFRSGKPVVDDASKSLADFGKANRDLSEADVLKGVALDEKWKDLQSAIRATKDLIGSLFFDPAIIRAEWLTKLVDGSRELLRTWLGLDQAKQKDFVAGLGDSTAETAFKLLVDLGQQLAGIWRDILVPAGQSLMEIISGIAQRFGNVTSTQVAAFFIAAAIAVTGLLVALKGIAFLLTPITGLLSLFGGFGPILLAAAAAALLFWDELKEGASKALALIPEELKQIQESFADLFKGDFAGFWEKFSAAGVSAFQKLKAAFLEIKGVENLIGTIGTIKSLLTGLVDVADRVAKAINNVFGTNLTGADVGVVLILAQMTGALQALASIAVIAGVALGGFIRVMGLLVAGIGGLPALIVLLGGALAAIIWPEIAAGVDKVWQRIKSLAKLLSGDGSSAWESFKDAAVASINTTTRELDALLELLEKIIQATINAAKRFNELRAPEAPLPAPGGVPGFDTVPIPVDPNTPPVPLPIIPKVDPNTPPVPFPVIPKVVPAQPAPGWVPRPGGGWDYNGPPGELPVEPKLGPLQPAPGWKRGPGGTWQLEPPIKVPIEPQIISPPNPPPDREPLPLGVLPQADGALAQLDTGIATVLANLQTGLTNWSNALWGTVPTTVPIEVTPTPPIQVPIEVDPEPPIQVPIEIDRKELIPEWIGKTETALDSLGETVPTVLASLEAGIVNWQKAMQGTILFPNWEQRTGREITDTEVQRVAPVDIEIIPTPPIQVPIDVEPEPPIEVPIDIDPEATVARLQRGLQELFIPSMSALAAASGGLLGGRGTGTSDSNLAWLSRGEHIMPARAVRQPGVLAFLETLRRSGGNLQRALDGVGRFALGGLAPRQMTIPASSGGLNRGMSNVTIQFPGLPAIGGLRASSDVVDELRKAAALAQVRSGGRKPSRYS